MLFTKTSLRSGALIAFLTMTASAAYAHVTIQPKQSATGASQTYTMRVPTEKFVPTVRVEVEFPAGLEASPFDSKPGWKIDSKKDASGKIVGAVLSGSIPPGEALGFTFTATNPREEGKLSWKVIQIYEDGTKSEWTDVQGSRTPAPVVEIVKSAVR
jgi:uncharacterized protein YcnI